MIRGMISSVEAEVARVLKAGVVGDVISVSYTHLRAHET